MARDSTESRFRQALEELGGPQNVLLIGELWDRAQSRDLLESFLQTVFPGEKKEGVGNPNSKDPHDTHRGSQEPDSNGSREQPAESTGPKEAKTKPHCNDHQSSPDRALRFPLVFFLCRAESLRLRESRRQLREIFKDLRERTRGGAAVIGVIVPPGRAIASGEEQSDGYGEANSGGPAPDSVRQDVACLLSLLQSVFPPGSQGGWEVRAAAFTQGQDETRKDVQNVACEALAAADVNKSQRLQTKFQCLPWIRSKKKRNPVEKGNIEDGTALNVIRYPNGECTENSTDT
eukprot:XP_002937397.2 PREDICTED: uncharacterized protein C2orf72 homolog [Xenopus tropicalis]